MKNEEKKQIIDNTIDVLNCLLNQQGGLINESNNMIYNISGLIDRLEELKTYYDKLIKGIK